MRLNNYFNNSNIKRLKLRSFSYRTLLDSFYLNLLTYTKQFYKQIKLFLFSIAIVSLSIFIYYVGSVTGFTCQILIFKNTRP